MVVYVLTIVQVLLQWDEQGDDHVYRHPPTLVLLPFLLLGGVRVSRFLLGGGGDQIEVCVVSESRLVFIFIDVNLDVFMLTVYLSTVVVFIYLFIF